MSARSTLAACFALLMLAGTAGADEPGAAATGNADAVSERGLQPRIPLAQDEPRVYTPSPAAGAETPPIRAGQADDDLDLSRHLALNLAPTALSSPSEAGRRLGHGNVVLSVPLSDGMDLRTGVRVDYHSSPASETFQAEATPTLGVGFEF